MPSAAIVARDDLSPEARGGQNVLLVDRHPADLPGGVAQDVLGGGLRPGRGGHLPLGAEAEVETSGQLAHDEHPPDGEEALFGPHRGGEVVPARSAHRAHENGVGGQASLARAFGEGNAALVHGLPPEGEGLAGVVQAEAAGNDLEHPQGVPGVGGRDAAGGKKGLGHHGGMVAASKRCAAV